MIAIELGDGKATTATHYPASEPARTLLVLAHGAGIDSEDLQRLSEAGVRVRVQYEDAPNLIAHVAHDVQPETFS